MLFLSVVLLLVLQADAACTRDSFTTFPALPQPPTQTLSGVTPTGDVTQNHWSRAVVLPRPPAWTGHAPQTNCPHLQSGLSDWHDPATWGGSLPANGANVTIPAGKKVLLSSCSVNPTWVFKFVVIPSSSALIFGDANITFAAKGIDNQGGQFLIGSPTCRLRNYITITLHGKRSDYSFPASPFVKGIASTGAIDIHGVEYAPTWTRLASTAYAGNTTIFIQDCPNWEVGHRIFITTTEFKDSRDFNRNEELTITGMFKTSVGAKVCAIRFTPALAYRHYGGKEYQAEVGLLTRRIKVQGAPDSEPSVTSPVSCTHSSKPYSTYPCEKTHLDGFGAHIMAIGSSATIARFSGLEVYRGGQTNVMARYPIHYHMLGNRTEEDALVVSDCSVHHSYFRCVTVHGTSGKTLAGGVTVTKNVGFDVIGHCYFCSEDGIEENNTISYNLAAYVHPLGPTWQTMYSLNTDASSPYDWSVKQGQSFGSQYTNYIRSNPNLILADDIAASPFYFTNAHVAIFGNAASGGWAGFTFPNLIAPKGAYHKMTWFVPKNRPLIIFKGNSAHSTGYYQGHAAGVYLGGDLRIPAGTPDAERSSTTEYTTGRYLPARSTNDALDGSKGKPLWLRFEDTKVFLANVGLQSWGDREEIIKFETHDVQVSTNVFGQVWIDQMVVNCRSQNTPTYLAGCSFPVPPYSNNAWNMCNDADKSFHNGRSGFQFYDTGQSHLVTNSIFSNCKNTGNDCLDKTKCGLSIFLYLTHSDQFTPALMQQTKNITYENIDAPYIAVPSVAASKYVSVSGRAANWLDVDGTVNPALGFQGKKVSIGSNYTGADWWRLNSQCVNTMNNWFCPMNQGDALASALVHWSDQESQIGSGVCSNGKFTTPCPIGAYVTHFGRSEANAYPVAVSSRVTGPVIASQGGWFIKYAGGTPAKVFFDYIQVGHEDILHVAIPYPRGTTWNIYAQGPSNCLKGETNSWSPVGIHTYRRVNSIEEMRAAWGDAYYYDSNTQLLHLRLVDMFSFGYSPCFHTYGDRLKPENINWTSTSYKSSYFSRGGLDLQVNPSSAYSVRIDSSCSGRCADVGAVPPAIPFTKLPTPVAVPKAPTTPPTAFPTAPPKVPVAGPPTAPPTAPPVAPPTAPPVAPPTKPPTAPPTAPPVAPPTKPPTAPPVAPPTAPPVAPPTKPPTAPPTGSPPVAPKAPTSPPVAPKAPTAPPTVPKAPPTGSPPVAPKAPTAPPTVPKAPPTGSPPVAPKAPTAPPTAPKAPTAPPTVPKAPTAPPKAPPTGSPPVAPKAPTAPPTVPKAPTAPPTVPKAPTAPPKAPPVAPPVDANANPITNSIAITNNKIPSFGIFTVQVGYTSYAANSRITVDIQSQDYATYYGGGTLDVPVGTGVANVQVLLRTPAPTNGVQVRANAWIVKPANYGVWQGASSKQVLVTAFVSTPPPVAACTVMSIDTANSGDWWIQTLSAPAGYTVGVSCGNTKQVACTRATWGAYTCAVSNSQPSGPCPAPRTLTCKASGARLEGEEAESGDSAFPLGAIIGMTVAGTVLTVILLVAFGYSMKKKSNNPHAERV